MSNVNYIGSTDTLYILTKLKAVLDGGYVAKEDGKGLSTNDLTNELLAKLNASKDVSYEQIAESGDDTIKIATITINSVATDIYAPRTIVDLAVSDDSTNPVQNKIIKKYIDDAVASVIGIHFEIVASIEDLPTVGKDGTIYLVPNTGSGKNIYDEYAWIESLKKYEKLGTTDIDLTPYLLKADLVEVSTTDIDTMFNNVFGE